MPDDSHWYDGQDVRRNKKNVDMPGDTDCNDGQGVRRNKANVAVLTGMMDRMSGGIRPS
jgi:hypothetical protein